MQAPGTRIGAEHRACAACGGTVFADRTIIWDRLADAWELTPEERAYVDRQQGTMCTGCGASLRSAALAQAVLDAVGAVGPLASFIAMPMARRLRVLELNEAGSLNPLLRQLRGHRFGAFPEVDMQALPYEDGSFDLVLHSDTLEHVPDPLRALAECRRVLRPGGAVCFTVPTIIGRMSRSRTGLPPSYHGFPTDSGEDLKVHTEFGADMWTWVLRAGFDAVTITPVEYPAALAMTGWAAAPAPLLRSTKGDVVRAAMDLIEAHSPRPFGRAMRRGATALRNLYR